MYMNIDKEIKSIIAEWKSSDNNEPLDGDEVERLVNYLRNEINFMEGNLTDEEYNTNLEEIIK